MLCIKAMLIVGWKQCKQQNKMQSWSTPYIPSGTESYAYSTPSGSLSFYLRVRKASQSKYYLIIYKVFRPPKKRYCLYISGSFRDDLAARLLGVGARVLGLCPKS